MKSPLKILSLEDDPMDRELILATLARANISCEAIGAESGPEFIEALESGSFDLILSDHSLPGFDGESALKLSLEKAPGVPFIFVSGAMGEDLAIELIKSGATDYVLKHRLSRLALAVRRAIAEAEERAARHKAEEIAAARTRELAEVNERLTNLDRSKNEFLNLISHEFRAPLAGLLGVSELVLEKMSSTAGHNQLKESFYRSRRRMLSILDDALLLTRVDVSGEKFGSALVPLDAALDGAIENAAAFAESHCVMLKPMRLPSTVSVLGNEELLVRAFHALLETAVKFSEAGSAVELTSQMFPDSLIVVIETHGKTISRSAIENFFDIFATGETNTPGGDHGLGPALACRILSLFDASVAIANRDEGGIRMIVTFRAFRSPHIPLTKLPKRAQTEANAVAPVWSDMRERTRRCLAWNS